MLKRIAKSCVAILVVMSLLSGRASQSVSFSLSALASDVSSKRKIENEDLAGIDEAIRTKNGAKLLTLWESLLSGPIAESGAMTQRMLDTTAILLSLSNNSVSIIQIFKLNRDFIKYSRQYGLAKKLQIDLIKKLQLYKNYASEIISTTEANLQLHSDIESRREFLLHNIEARKKTIFSQSRFLPFNSEVLLDPPPLTTESEREELRMLLQRTQELSSVKDVKDVKESSVYLHIATYQFYLSQFDDVLFSLERYYESIRAEKLNRSSQLRDNWFWYDLLPAMELIRAFAAMKNFFRAEQAAYMFMSLVSIPNQLKRTPVMSAPEVFQSYVEKTRKSIYDVHRVLALQNTRRSLDKGESLQAYCRLKYVELNNNEDILESVNLRLSAEKLKVTSNSCKRSIQNNTHSKNQKKTSINGFFAQEQSILWDKRMEEVLSEKNKNILQQKTEENSDFEGNRTTAQDLNVNRATEKTNTEDWVDSSIWFYLFAVPASIVVYPCLGLGMLMPRSGSIFKDSAGAAMSVATCSGTLALGTTSLLAAHLAEKRTEAIHFIAWNRESLVREFAQQRGEFVSAFFESLSLDAKQGRLLVELIAENHSFVFSDQDPALIFDRIVQVAEFDFSKV